MQLFSAAALNQQYQQTTERKSQQLKYTVKEEKLSFSLFFSPSILLFWVHLVNNNNFKYNIKIYINLQRAANPC